MTLGLVAQEILYPGSIFWLEQVDDYRVAQPIENMPDLSVTPAQKIRLYPRIIFCPSADDFPVTEEKEKASPDSLFVSNSESCDSAVVDSVQVFLRRVSEASDSQSVE
jgi:hypothetical protein